MSKVTLQVRDTIFAFWEALEITRDIDAVSSIRLSAPFYYKAQGFKENFQPFGYAPIKVNVSGKSLFTGTMIDCSPVIEPDRKVIAVNAYAKCGVLADCTAPITSLPLEFNNLNLQQIASRLAEPFKIGVVFKAEPGAAFERVACDPDKKILDFLTDLAKQRGLVISSTEDGELLFWRSTDSTSVARLEQGTSPLISVTPSFNPQEFYSEMTGLAEVEVDKEAQKTTVKTRKESKKYNRYSVTEESAAFRPLIFKIDDVEGADVETATKAALGRMLGNMATYDVELSTWHDRNGNVWSPNTSIEIKAPDAMIYDYYKFTIKSVTLSADAESRTAKLVLALPGAFNGEAPEVMPWEL